MRRLHSPLRWASLLVAASLTLAACATGGGEQTTTTAGESASGATTTTAPTGGTAAGGEGKPEIVAALWGAPNLIEPHTFRTVSAYAVTNALYEPLLDVQYEQQPSGVLLGIRGQHVGLGAESYEVTETADGLIGRFYLRKDAKFPDGTPVTAQDYKYTFDRSMLADFSYITLLMPFIGVDSPDQIRVVDDYTLEIETKAKSPLFERFMTFQVFGAINQKLVEANATADDPWGAEYLKSNGAGSGPYVVESFQPDRDVVLKPNPYYWDAANVANAGVTIRTVPDANQRALLVRTGEIDIATGIPPKLLAELANDNNVKIVSRPTSGVTYLGMNQKIAPLDNVNVRRAIVNAVPYSALIDQVMYGYASPAGGVVTSPMETYDPAIGDQFRQDLDKARQYLAESGVQNLNLVLGVRESAETDQEAAVLIQDALRQIGIQVEVQILPDADYAAKLNADELPLFIHDWFSWGEDPFYQMTFLTTCGSFVNYARFCNEEYDSLVEQGKFTLDPQERQDISSQTQRIFYDEAVWAPLWSVDRTAVVGRCVVGLSYGYTDLPGFKYVTKTDSC